MNCNRRAVLSPSPSHAARIASPTPHQPSMRNHLCLQSGGRSYIPPCKTTLRRAMTGAVLLAKCPLPETFTAFLHRRTEQSCESVFLLDEVGVPLCRRSLRNLTCRNHAAHFTTAMQAQSRSHLLCHNAPFLSPRVFLAPVPLLAHGSRKRFGTSTRGFCHTPPYCIGFIS